MADNTDIQYEAPTWNQVYAMLLCQVQKIQSDCYKPDIIVGIARGGIVPSRILSDLLETRDLTTIQIEYYEGINQTKEEPSLKQCLNLQLTDKKVLLVDDVSDTGNSLQLAKNHLKQNGAKEIKIATLYTKPTSITKPDYYEKLTINWIVFPWDIKENVRKIIENHQVKNATGKEIEKLVKSGLPSQLTKEFLKDMQ
ncbi:MAG: phosphoribosyltransferase [Candidatus Bathyarchaeia archaeon]